MQTMNHLAETMWHGTGGQLDENQMSQVSP